MKLLKKFTLPKTLSLFFWALPILVGAWFRIWKVTQLPYPPHGDELAFGYYGWSLLHFGTDEYGNVLPLYFPSIGDFKFPTLAYLNIVPAIFFGLSEITVKFWSLLSGIFLIFLVSVLSKLLFNSWRIGLAAAWLVALNPWSISLSRMGYESHVSVVLTTLGIIFLLLTEEKFSKRLFGVRAKIIASGNHLTCFGLSFVFLFLSLFCYSPQRVVIPLLLLSILLVLSINGRAFEKLKRTTIVLFLLLTTIAATAMLPWQSRARADSLLARLSPTDTNRLEELSIEAGISPVKVPVLLTHLFHNRTKLTILNFVQRYLNHYSTDFLFIKGGPELERIPEVGQLLLIELVFLPLGLVKLLGTKALKRPSLIILLWLLAAPIPSAMTYGGPHIVRAAMMIPPLAIISGCGLYAIIDLFKNQALRIVAGIIIAWLLLVNSVFVANQLFVHKPVSKPWVSEQGTREMAKEVYQLKDQYQSVAITDDEYIFFIFYNRISPKEFVSKAAISPFTPQSHWKKVDRLENIYFNMPTQCPKAGKLDTLYVCSGQNIPQNSKVIKVFRFGDGVPHLTLVEFYPASEMPRPLPTPPPGLTYWPDIDTKYPDGIIPADNPLPW